MDVVILVTLVSLAAWAVVHDFWPTPKRVDMSVMAQLEGEFRKIVVKSTLAEMCFDGSTADVVDDHLEGLNDNNSFILQRVHRFARNTHGEYFYCVLEGTGNPFVKYVTQANAKAALGKKYVAPAVVTS